SLQDPMPQKRLNAAVALKSFVNPKDTVKNSQIILSIASALAFEENEISRSGMVNVLRSLNFNLIDSNTLNEGLRSLVNLNRVLAKEDRILYPDTSKSKQGIL